VSTRGGLLRVRKQAGGGPRGGRSSVRGERGRGYGPGIGPARVGKVSSFIFLNDYFHFLFIFLLSPFLLNN
jgi:hypothetical protein